MRTKIPAARKRFKLIFAESRQIFFQQCPSDLWCEFLCGRLLLLIHYRLATHAVRCPRHGGQALFTNGPVTQQARSVGAVADAIQGGFDLLDTERIRFELANGQLASGRALYPIQLIRRSFNCDLIPFVQRLLVRVEQTVQDVSEVFQFGLSHNALHELKMVDEKAEA